jgi:hypothetical protein
MSSFFRRPTIAAGQKGRSGHRRAHMAFAPTGQGQAFGVMAQLPSVGLLFRPQAAVTHLIASHISQDGRTLMVDFTFCDTPFTTSTRLPLPLCAPPTSRSLIVQGAHRSKNRMKKVCLVAVRMIFHALLGVNKLFFAWLGIGHIFSAKNGLNAVNLSQTRIILD